jgi:hypothetical protein
MGKIRETVVMAPYVCEAEDSGAWSFVNSLLFDEELKQRERALQRKSFTMTINRVKLAFGFTAFKHNKDKAAYMMKLGELMCLSHYIYAHQEHEHIPRQEALKRNLSAKEHLYPEIASLMTVEEASSSLMTSWN